MALKAGGGILAWIHDEAPAPAADTDMFAGRPVARFATGDRSELNVILGEAAMRAGGE